MTDKKRELMAKHLLSLFRDIWCDRESEEKPFFNCSKCEFETEDGKCILKIFIKSVKYDDDCPQGAIEGGDEA
jgi:hypothetical protein